MDAFTGHYAAYILPAWGLSILALAWMTASALVSAYRWRKAALKRDDARRDAGAGKP